MTDQPWLYVIGLGSNMPGDSASPDVQVRAAAEAVLKIPGTTLVNSSQLYATAPWGKVTQDEFRNAVITVRSRLEPLKFLHACQEIETAAGRVRLERWGPRTVDIDLLAAYDETGESVVSRGRWDEELILPHPYSSVRGFVLVPWAEIGGKDLLVDVPASRGLDGQETTLTIEQWVAKLNPEETAGIEIVGPAISECG